MTGGRAETALDWLEAARGRCDPQALERLWAAVPEPMRLSRFAESSVPPQYAGAFCHDGTWQTGIDLSGLPAPMRRELAWCVFRIIETVRALRADRRSASPPRPHARRTRCVRSNPWTKAMTKRRRKTLVVCADCHDRIHGTQPTTFTA